MGRADRLTTGQAARLLRVTPDTILKWIKRGKLPATRTVGGHHRIAREAVESLAHQVEREAAAPGSRRLMACWEYYAEDGAIREECRRCLVYRARAARCYEMSSVPHEHGYAGVFCNTTCDECPYFQEVTRRPQRLLVVSDSVRLRDRLKAENVAGRFLIEFATCEYECSAVIDSFRPEVVVVDCSLPGEVCSDLCNHLAADPRIPEVAIVVAVPVTQGGDKRVALPPNVSEINLPFSLSDLQRCTGSGEARVGGVKGGRASEA